MSVSEESEHARFNEVAGVVVEPVRRYLYRRVDQATADDVLSEVLVVLWRRGIEVPVGGEIPYAIGVARLQLQNALRSMRRQERLVARIITIDPPHESVSEQGAGDPWVGLVRQALGQLGELDAEVLRLHVWEELAVSEVAEVLTMTPNAVSIRLHRAKKKLADKIRKMAPGVGHTAAKKGGQS
ncbi:RNA polymerase sigma factor [Curtobacterium sp. NPDC089689]|uniref:RNA polymerase sigma factor n=1 Tax=Curtobacterium sp. NPDC089689 TaxID=3363968 RepID=UPI0037F2731F